MDIRQSDRNLSLNAVRLNNVRPTAVNVCRHAMDRQAQPHSQPHSQRQLQQQIFKFRSNQV